MTDKKMRSNQATLETLRQLRSVLLYHQTAGIEEYQHSADIAEFLQMSSAMLLKQTDAQKHDGAPLAQGKSREASQQVPPNSSSVQERIGDIKKEVAICRKCDLAERRVVPVNGIGAGNGRVKLLIVGGWLALEPACSAATATGNDVGTQVFGTDEDRMVARMLDAIHLSSEEAFITNLIKCGIETTSQPQARHIDACISYLQRQIAATGPDVICTMGIVASRTLLQMARPLSQLRGRFHSYRLGQDHTIPVMPTYHPNFLLKNPEMKKATWSDLQSIQKKLAK
jgi:DNA polymerase